MKSLSKIGTMLFALSFTLVFMAIGFAQDVGAFPEPQGDITALLLNLASNYKTLGLFGILSILIVISVQGIKRFVSDEWKYKRLLTLLMSIVFSVLSGLVVPGANTASVIVTVFVSSGGAIALYEALRGAGIIKKS